MMILIISTCKEPLHEMEFVKPIEKILKEKKVKYFAKHYSKITKTDLQKAKKIVICGTSIKDNEFAKHVKSFDWIKDLNSNQKLLGICAGMQIISLVFGQRAKPKKKKEIGYYFEFFEKEFLGLKGEHEVYHLHNNYATLPKEFISFTESKIPQAIKHSSKDIYGVLFHPEVRNRKMIEFFTEL